MNGDMGCGRSEEMNSSVVTEVTRGDLVQAAKWTPAVLLNFHSSEGFI
jgi:hypothetical protein